MDMPGTSELFDIQAIIDDFVADTVLPSMELPHMTTGQRKNTKKTLEQYPELKCESFGFGKDRKLHLFKVTISSEVASTEVPETFETQVEPLVCDPTPTNAVQFIMDGPVCKLDLSSIKDAVNRANGMGEASIDGSTIAPSSDCSPASTFRGKSLPSWFRLPPGLELEVQNTFIHYKRPPVQDPRTVQSMPHSMFQKCLLAEISEKAQMSNTFDDSVLPTAEFVEENDSAPPVGTMVTIEGLSKLPAFNGLVGSFQCFDEETGRYMISLSTPVSGHKTVKVKRENFRVTAGQYTPAQQPLPLKLTSLVSENTVAPRSLKLTGLV